MKYLWTIMFAAMLSRVVAEEPIFQPTGVYSVQRTTTVTKAKRREWYLVSESWCANCPRAKSAFRAKGWPDANILTIAECERRFGFRPPHVPFEFGEPLESQTKTVTRTVTKQRLPVVQTQWGTIDLETYQRNCNCPMCQGIRSLQSQYRQSLRSLPPEQLTPVPPHQEPTPFDTAREMLDLMGLDDRSILADYGCGDGRILILAAQRFNCCGIGIEIDPLKAEEARRSVEAAGLSSRIQIITVDALDFSASDYGVTHATAYLYPDLLDKLAATLKTIRVVASPYHEVPGIGQKRVGDIWIKVAK